MSVYQTSLRFEILRTMIRKMLSIQEKKEYSRGKIYPTKGKIKLDFEIHFSYHNVMGIK